MDAQHVFPLIFWETENDVVVLFIVIFSPLTGLREWFSQSDESQVLPRIPVMVNMTPSASSKKGRKAQENTTQTSLPMDPSRHSTILEEESDEDDEFLIPESEQEVDELLIVFPVDLLCHFLNKTMFSMQPSTREDAEDVKQPGMLIFHYLHKQQYISHVLVHFMNSI